MTPSPHISDSHWLLRRLPDATQDEIERFQERVSVREYEGYPEIEARSLTLEDIRRDRVGVAA
jgi:hypothetical protein